MNLGNMIKNDLSTDQKVMDFFKKNEIFNYEVNIKKLSDYDLLDKDYIFYLLNIRRNNFDKNKVSYINFTEAIESVGDYSNKFIRWIPIKIRNILCVYLVNEYGSEIISKIIFKIPN